ncbi:UDP-N-acetylglucosamine 4,6-dehydratase (inverting) [Marinobacter xestospongiae]|uniref:UDP-N-acetylglucosamine 4,6-dehydratase (inverting) n=1 Tax=Marinobacter xestospongiae TaxID=994319 RepID=UPI002004C2A1|nr:UDP-N-acetylglucosamine 4,6-dehydratase (inverting) [Marinobacter xestospongiae]MCK7568887.1 UDP-N-acetylglucosamine 4,6-dehydratase (inverting) [Marinobacter xestospongiae]
MFNNKSVLITGGTGSFGQKFVDILLQRYKPARVIIFSRDELKQYEMQQRFNQPCMRYFLGDVRDRERLEFATRDVDYCIHAAALKQVPAAEYNPMECIRTNINGAENVTHACMVNQVRRVIALSTDKAANPVNLYGATKLASDKLFIAANNIVGKRPTRFSVVRYGNVLGSRGSVVPFFRELLARGEESLPVTHEEMTRFWITLEQGVEFVFRSFERMQGGEIFVPRIPSAKITDLVQAMSDNGAYRLVGMRPGEKLHEIMVPEEMAHHTLAFDDHFVIAPPISFFDKDNDYTTNKLGECGQPVTDRFEYHSGTNPDFLSVEELRELVATV